MVDRAIQYQRRRRLRPRVTDLLADLVIGVGVLLFATMLALLIVGVGGWMGAKLAQGSTLFLR